MSVEFTEGSSRRRTRFPSYAHMDKKAAAAAAIQNAVVISDIIRQLQKRLAGVVTDPDSSDFKLAYPDRRGLQIYRWQRFFVATLSGVLQTKFVTLEKNKLHQNPETVFVPGFGYRLRIEDDPESLGTDKETIFWFNKQGRYKKCISVFENQVDPSNPAILARTRSERIILAAAVTPTDFEATGIALGEMKKRVSAIPVRLL